MVIDIYEYRSMWYLANIQEISEIEILLTLECRYLYDNAQIAGRNRTRGHSIGLGKIFRMKFSIHF